MDLLPYLAFYQSVTFRLIALGLTSPTDSGTRVSHTVDLRRFHFHTYLLYLWPIHFLVGKRKNVRRWLAMRCAEMRGKVVLPPDSLHGKCVWEGKKSRSDSIPFNRVPVISSPCR
uniref:Uncharacterized protein n=1 Tax=Picea sitchensis TaxID=3332 RepID=A0A6B9XX91_PICSI|nr:hypothetical protein Q903MT_gene5792 [Picea sitchensis]